MEKTMVRAKALPSPLNKIDNQQFFNLIAAGG